MLGVNADGLCVITSNVTACRAYCVIIIGIWNDDLVFLVGADMAGSSSIIIGFWGVCVGVGVSNASTVRSSYTTTGEVSACMGCRCGELLLGYCLSVCPIYFFSFMAGNTMSQMLYVWGGGVHPMKWVGHPIKCAVQYWKALLSILGVGPV